MAAEKIKPYHWWKHTNCQRHTMPARRFEIKYGKNIGYGIYCKLLEIILFLEGSLKKKDVILYCEEFGMSEKELLDVLDYGLSCEVFYENGEAYHCEFIDEVYAHGVAISEVKSDAGKTKPQANEAANDVAKDIVKPQAKPKAKPEPVPESEDIQRLRGYVAAIIADFPDGKNSKNELTTEQYQKLIDKYGYSKLVVMQRIYFEWKVSRKEKTKTTDFGTLNKGDGWVASEADKHEPEPELPKEEPWVRPEWNYAYPKPDNYETMDQRQITAYVVACARKQSDLETAKWIETSRAKAAQEAKEAAEEAERLRWKYPFPKPEFWDGMSEPAKASYIRRNTLPEDVAK